MMYSNCSCCIVKFASKQFCWVHMFLQSLYSSVVIAGGNSLLTGFTDRLQRDLQHKTPHVSTGYILPIGEALSLVV